MGFLVGGKGENHWVGEHLSQTGGIKVSNNVMLLHARYAYQ